MPWVKLPHPLAEVPALFFYHPDSLLSPGAQNGCAKTLGTRLLNGWQLSRLSTFEVAARHESFALAADELALTPSAVSHRINQLEEELGIQLFVRSHRKVELTREGKRVYWALKASLDGLNQEILDIKTRSSPAV